MSWERLTDDQWERVKKVIPPRKIPWKKKSRRGRKYVDDRKCFAGILWILWTGSPWLALPKIYGAKSTVHRRLKSWAENGVLEKLWRAFLSELEDKDQLRWNECFVDGTFSSAKKGGKLVGKTKRGKGTKLMLMVDGRGTPIGLPVESASHAEVKLLEATLNSLDIPGKKVQPQRLITDKAYDSNNARQLIKDRGMLPIIPARKNNTRATHQDGRHLRRYGNRWIIERTIAWLQNFRRLVVRYERSSIIFTGLIHMAFAMMILKRFHVIVKLWDNF